MSIIESRRQHRHARFGFVARATVVGAAAALSCLLAPVASAKDAAIARSRVATHVVRYSDLDLTNQSDAKELYARLQNASEFVCSSHNDQRDLRLKRLQAACVDDALANAVEQVNQVKVSALHAADKRMRVAQSTRAPG